jgi:hypothetical protein
MWRREGWRERMRRASQVANSRRPLSTDLRRMRGESSRSERMHGVCRQPDVDICRPQQGAVAAGNVAFCNSTQNLATHCIHAGRYCQMLDPDGGASPESSGRDALVEMLRCKCVGEVTRRFHQPHFLFTYMRAWNEVCLPQNNYSNECALKVFRTAAVDNWTSDALNKASATPQVCPASLPLLHSPRFTHLLHSPCFTPHASLPLLHPPRVLSLCAAHCAHACLAPGHSHTALHHLLLL